MTVSSPECYLECGCIFHDHGQIWHSCDVAVSILRRAIEAARQHDYDLYASIYNEYNAHMGGRAKIEEAR